MVYLGLRRRRKWHDGEKLHDLNSSPNIAQVEKDEICGTCDTYGGEEMCMQSVGGER